MNLRQHLESKFECPSCPQKIIIGCKGGLEDIQAIVIAIYLSKKYNKQIIGITCVGGQIESIDGAALDALVACTLTDVKIPIYKGSHQSMLLTTEGSKVYGRQGSYQAAVQLRQILAQENSPLLSTKSAIIFLVESARKYKDNLGIIAIGPLTNIAIAYHLDYSFGKIKMLSVYGGQYTGVGNVVGQYSSEANFKFDPQAAHLVLKNFQQNVYINPLQNSVEFNYGEQFIKQLHNIIEKSPKKKYLQKLFFGKNKFYAGWGEILAVFPMFLPESVKTMYYVYCEVSLELDHIQGFLAIDWLRMSLPQGHAPKNTRIYSKFNNELITKTILELFAQ